MQHLLIQKHSFEFPANKNTDLHLQYDFVQHRLALGTSLRSYMRGTLHVLAPKKCVHFMYKIIKDNDMQF